MKQRPDMKQLIAHLAEIKTQTNYKGRTAELWQYLEHVRLIMLYIRAEWTGDLSLYVYTLRSMLPYFQAVVLLNYVKSVQLYLQQMEEFENEMKPEELGKLSHN